MASSLLQHAAPSSRVELFRLLSEADRLRVLALCAEEELSVGELCTLLQDTQPQVSRKVAPLRQAGLLEARREGTRTYLRTRTDLADPVLNEALAEGRRLTHEDGSLARLPSVLSAREARGQALFEVTEPAQGAESPPSTPHLAHLAALAPLLPGRALAVDVGTGEGLLLDLLVPLYSRVIAVDRSPARLARCAARVAARGFTHVSLFSGSYEDVALLQRVDSAGGADLVYASRTLHHAARPAQAVGAFARLLRPGGHLVLLEYLPHTEERMREEEGDVWLGFPSHELWRYLEEAGLERVAEVGVPPAFHPDGPDARLGWQAYVARSSPSKSSKPS